MIVNRSYKRHCEADLRVDLPGKTLEELDRITGAWVAGPDLNGDRRAKLKLAPGDGRLFRMRTGGAK